MDGQRKVQVYITLPPSKETALLTQYEEGTEKQKKLDALFFKRERDQVVNLLTEKGVIKSNEVPHFIVQVGDEKVITPRIEVPSKNTVFNLNNRSRQ